MKNASLKRRNNIPAAQKGNLIFGQRFSGPIPPPQALQAYEATLVGLADRIVVMAEQEQKERFREAERRAEDAHNANAAQRRGQWFAFLSVLVLALSALGCAWLKMPWVGCALAGTTLAGAVAAFLDIRKNNSASP